MSKCKRTAEQLRRLKVLADFFRNFASQHDPVEQFNIDLFAVQGDCGTVACVAGWAGLIPEFREQGLETEVLLLWADETQRGSGCRFGGRSGTFALSGFLGLTDSERRDLCFASGYAAFCTGRKVTTEMVTARLEEYIANTEVTDG